MFSTAIKNFQSVSSCVVLELVPLMAKIPLGPRLSNEILEPLRLFFENFPRALCHFYLGVPPGLWMERQKEQRKHMILKRARRKTVN